ncbi:MAG: helix-turn-helix domain-containing protein [Spirochaetia bacterium]|nr:helix-turn-helix domain-containing protein [Spirochaetia bacterium]
MGLLSAAQLSAEGTAGTEFSAIPHISVFEDQSARATIEEASSFQFHPIATRVFDQGFSKSAFWLKVQVPELKSKEQHFIVFESLTLNRADFYADPATPMPLKAGTIFPRSGWAIPWSDYATFPVRPGTTYLIRVHTSSLILMPVTFRSESNLRSFTEQRTYLSAAYAGFICMLALAAILVYITLRDIVYIYYAGYITFQTLAFASFFSSFYRLLWPESPYIQNHLYFFAQATSLALGAAFFRVFMDLPIRTRYASAVVLSIIALSIMVAVGSLFSTHKIFFSTSVTVLYFLWIPIFLALTVRELRWDRIDICIFGAVWGAIYIAGILHMLMIARVLPYSNVLFYGPTVLLPLDAIFFVVSLYQRYQKVALARMVLEGEMKSALARLTSNSENQNGEVAAKYPRSKLSGVDISKKLDQLDSILRVEKAYRDENLTLADLAEKLQISPHQLSEICNAHVGTSFPKLLSYHRVNEALILLKDGELNILGVAFAAGFASKSAFNIEFKRVTGMTPSEYRAKLNHAPTEELSTSA